MQSSRSYSIWPSILLLGITSLYRFVLGWIALQHRTDFNGLLAWLPNFFPFAAIAVCGGFFFTKRIHFVILIASVLLSDYSINAIYHLSSFTPEGCSRYLSLALLLGFGYKARVEHFEVAKNSGRFFGAVFSGSILFYIISNSIAWLYPGSFMLTAHYSLSFSGWFQALTTGLPGFPPTWLFFRNALVSDFLYSGTLLLCMFPYKRGQTATAQEEKVLA